MTKMAEQSNNGYPMISEKNWWTIRDKFKATVPSVVSANYIKTLLTMSSDNSANSNVINPMKRLGLIDDDNKPTSLANDWRLDDKYSSVCDEIIKSVYPTELLELFPDSNVDRNSAKNWFMAQGVGDGAANKMAALFILLKSGEIKEKKATNASKDKTKKKSDSKIEPAESSSIKTQAKNIIVQDNIHSSSSKPNLHIDLQIHISPESSSEQIETIFASMAKHLYGANN